MTRRVVHLLGGALAGALWRAAPEARWSPASRVLRAVPWLLGAYGVVVAAVVAGDVLNGRGGQPGGVGFVLLLPLAGALVLAPRRPLDAWRAGTLWMVVVPFLLAPPAPPVAVEVWGWLLWTPLLLLGAWGAPGRTTLGVALVSVAAVLVLGFATPWHAGNPGNALLGIALPLGLGAALGARWDTRRVLAEERGRAERAQAERGALAERARIAREMHDVVAHHMSLIAVRCETAPYRLTLTEPAERELAEVAASAREALTEMQGLLGVLRSTPGSSAGGAGPERAPQPGFADVEPLLVAARAAGTALTWDVTGLDGPAPLGLTVHRIVQQGLANAAQHARGAPVHVTIGGDPLVVEIVNGVGHGSTPGAGVGIPAMRERAEVHGGTLDAGPTPDGFRLRAELPR